MTVFTQGIFHRSYPGTDTIKTEIIRPIFGSCPQYIDNIKTDMTSKGMDVNGVITAVYNIASAVVDEDRLNIYEVQVSDNVLMQRNKVGVKKAVSNYINEGEGALMFVYCPSKPEEWRISYITRDSDENSPSKRYTYLVGENEPCVTVTQRFNILVQRDELSRESIADAFSVEALSDEFFDKYKTLYANFIQYITGKRVVKSGSKWEEKQQHDPDAVLYAAFGNDDKRIRDYVKKLMGRITFLYFVQKKGWFNGDQNYLQHLFENSTQDYQNDFLDRVLEPFFYTVLNTDKPNRKNAFDYHNRNLKPSEVEWDVALLDQWKDIPFLNGGLFERDENDIVRSMFPPQFFENLNGYDDNFVNKIPQKDYPWDSIPGIFDLFAQYNFTIDENDPNDAEVGIDPEMLGKIFENLLEDNKDKGAFYTPKEIVQYMCRESLIAYLQTDAKDDAHKQRLRKFVTTHDASILENPEYVRQKIRDIKICDPAIGSGAFPMGMLDQLVACSEALDMHISNCSNRAEIKKHIIQNSIYGVDIERGAVDIARLRFWLSLVIDEEKAIPLPNLDYKIMQGNSLLEQYEGIDLSKLQNKVTQTKIYEPQKDLFGQITDGQLKMTFTQEITANNLQDLLKKYFYETNHSEKSKLKQEINNIVNDHIKYNIELRQKQIERFIGEDEDLISETESKIVAMQAQFPNQKLSASATAKFDTEILKARKRIEENRVQIQRLDDAFQNLLKEDFLAENQKFFLWHTWFADVFNRSSNQGFDVVIGNPPYVSAPTQISNPTLAKQRETLLLTDNYKSLYQKWDLYIPFIEKGIKLNCANGICTMIVPFPLTNQLYAKVLRQILTNDVNLFELADLHDTKIFENATVQNCIPFVQKTNSAHQTWISKIDTDKVISRAFLQNHSDLVQDEKNFVWNLTQEKRETNRHNDMHVLGDYCYISYGLRPNSDEKTAKGEFKKEDLISDVQDDIPRRQYIEAKDIEKYKINRVRFLEYGTDRSPALLTRPTFKELYNPHKLMFNVLGDLTGTIDTDQLVHNHSLIACVLWKDLISVENKSISSSIKKFSKMTRFAMEDLSKKVDLRYLLGIMNSQYANVLLKNLRGGDYHIYPEHIRNIPIPAATAAQQQPIIDLVDEILTKKKQNPSEDTTYLEGKIDKLVYELYGLTDEEIKVVEGK